MSYIQVLEERCTKCHICILECPTYRLAADPVSGLPYERKEANCIRCGHCAILCPTQAITLKDFPKTDQRTVDLDKMPAFEQAEVLLKTRRSARQYLDRQVPREQIERLLDIAQYAATASNSQQVTWLVCEQQETRDTVCQLIQEFLQELPEDDHRWDYSKERILNSGRDVIFRGAPHFAVTMVPKTHNNPEDGIIGLTYLEIACHAMGLGTCWGGIPKGFLRACSKLQEYLGISPDQLVCEVLMFGYKKLSHCPRLPPRNPLRIQYR